MLQSGLMIFIYKHSFIDYYYTYVCRYILHRACSITSLLKINVIPTCTMYHVPCTMYHVPCTIDITIVNTNTLHILTKISHIIMQLIKSYSLKTDLC